MNKTFMDAVRNRRSIYALGKEHVIPNETIRNIVEFAALHVPSPFNSQNGRIVVLLDAESEKLWNIVRETLRKIVPPEAFPGTSAKIDSFAAGFGTILFFEDQGVTDDLMAKYPLYKDKFPVWSLQSNGMLQFTVWTALEEQGLGASLQHYNPLIDTEVKKEWKLPANWTLLAEMPFGSVAAPAGEKEFGDLDSRVKIYGGT